jgi:Dolichyl-phosphate-mannose-protein mannosyltransferase
MIHKKMVGKAKESVDFRSAERVRFGAWVGLAVVAGVVLRLWLIVHAARIAGDTLLYGDIARNLLTHGVYGFTVSGHAPRPTLIRVPGYPLFLAACFRVFGVGHYQPVLYLQVLVDMATCGLASGLAGRLFGRRAAMAALWMGALCPFTASYVAAPLTETLSLFCIAVVFYGIERWRAGGMGFNRWLWVVGVGLAYAVLLRPEQGLLAAVVVPAMLWMVCGGRWRGGAVAWRAAMPVVAVAICVVLPLVPWTMRNWRTFHVLQPLAPRSATDPGELVPSGFNRWYRTWGIDFASTEEVYWNYDSDEIAVSDLPTRAFDSESQYARTAALLEEYDATTRVTPAIDDRFAALARERVAADPVRYYVTLPVARLLNMLLRPRLEMLEIPLEWWRWPAHKAKTAFAAGYGALNLAYLVVAGFGVTAWRRRGWDALGWSMVGYVALRCALLLTLDNSEPRYTLELFPVLFVWGAAVWGRHTHVTEARHGAPGSL